MPKISVLTAVFNAEPYLEESIQSVLNQDFDDFEFILVNDASTDGSEKILARYSMEPRVRIISNDKNLGCAESRNKAFLQSNSGIIAIHDADDISLPNRFSAQINVLDHLKPDIVGSYAHRIDKDGNIMDLMKYPPPTNERCIEVIKRWKLNPVIDPSSMFNRIILEENNLYTKDPKLSISPDFHLWCNALLKDRKIHNIKQPLIKYRIHENSNTIKKKFDMDAATNYIWFSFCKAFDDKTLNKGTTPV